jgi:hypothetical protein
MRNMDSNSNGLIDQAELIAALLPADQVYVCVKAACVSYICDSNAYRAYIVLA